MPSCRALIAWTLLSAATPGIMSGQRALQLTRTLHISADANDLVGFSRIAVSARGVVAVPQATDGRIVFFDRQGKRLGAFGSKGEGPWEFRNPANALGFLGDTLWVYDPLQRRMTWIGPDLKGIRMENPPTQVSSPQGVSGAGTVSDFYVVGASAGGMLAYAYPVFQGKPADWFPIGRDRHLLVRLGMDGRLQKVIARDGERDGQFCQWNSPAGAARGSFSIPLCKSPEWGSTPDGRTLVHLTNIVGESFRFTVLNALTGDTVVSREVAVTPRPVSQAALDSARTIRPGFPEQFVAARKALVFPKHHPSVSAMVVGTDGSVWIQQNTGAVGPRKWRGFSRTGQEIGGLELPSDTRLILAESGVLWASVRDADDLQDLIRFTYAPGRP